MFFFRKKTDAREAKIKAIKKETYKKVDVASESLKKVNELLDRDDVTLKIFYATGGMRRNKNG